MPKLELRSLLRTLKDKIREVWRVAGGVARGKAVETVEYEAEELDHIFGILVLGSFIGLPSPPMQISLDLMQVSKEGE